MLKRFNLRHAGRPTRQSSSCKVRQNAHKSKNKQLRTRGDLDWSEQETASSRKGLHKITALLSCQPASSFSSTSSSFPPVCPSSH
eukprot:768094-Hanusia_phi.AAC.3